MLEQFQRELLSLGAALLIALIRFLFQTRARLVWSLTHDFTFLLNAAGSPAGSLPTLNVRTLSCFILNASHRVPATEVELIFNWRPENYNVWPMRPYEEHTSPDGRFTLKFANLAPREQFQVELLTTTKLPEILNLRSKECVGKRIAMRPMQAFPNWVNWTAFVLMLLGLASIIYAVLKVFSLLAR